MPAELDEATEYLEEDNDELVEELKQTMED